MPFFDLPETPSPAIPLAVDAVDRAIAEAGRLVNGGPRFFLPLPVRAHPFRWSWRVEYGGRVVASGHAWTERGALKRRMQAYLTRLLAVNAERVGLCDRTEPIEQISGGGR